MSLPRPNSPKLNTLVKNAKARAIYGILFNNRNKPLSMPEIRNLLGLASGEQEHLNRRMRELYVPFKIERSRHGDESLYRLISLSDKPRKGTSTISIKLRAWVLRDQRCAMCGRTPSEDHVKLHVDHKIPRSLGGTDDPDNLQALCSDCNEGKKNFYSN